MAGAKWNRPLTDDQREQLNGLLDYLGLDEDSLDRPARGERVPITIHVTVAVAAYLDGLAWRYGLRGRNELSRVAVLGFARGTEHPGDDDPPEVFR